MTEREAQRVLQLPDDYTRADLRQAYLDLVKVWHPDRFAGDAQLRGRAEQRLRTINEAYAVLQGDSAPYGTSTPPTAEPSRDRTTPHWPPRLGTKSAILAALIIATLPFLAPLTTDRAAVVHAPAPDPTGEDVVLIPDRPRTPRATVDDPNRPASGLELLPSQPRGRGSIVVHNRATSDAAVVLSTENVHAYSMYVRAGEKVQALDVPAGDYQVLVALGRRWRNGRFTADEQFLAMDARLHVHEAASGGVNTAPASVTIPQTGMGGFLETPSFDLGINDP
jgi:hypothetical protein